MELQERQLPLNALDGWLSEAAAGKGRLVFIGGEAGVGKTALVDRFCQDARGRARVLRGSCDVLSTPRPLGPLLDFAAAAGGELDDLLSQDAPRDRVFRSALSEFNHGLTPTLAVVEDAHWADEATLDLLRFLGRRLEGVRTMLIVTYRDDEVGFQHPLRTVLGDLATSIATRRLDLAPLSALGIQALAAACPGGDELDSTALHVLTGGNPFFATEVLADISAAPGAVPVTVRDAVLARASRLDATARAALDAAAVIGTHITAEVLAEIAGSPAEAIEACLASGTLVDAGAREFAFRHELARSAIYDAVPTPKRSELHARALATLASTPRSARDLALLAHHAESAGDRDAVLKFAPEAARRAATLHAHREAAAQYARALRFSQSLSPRAHAELLEAFSYECYLTGNVTRAIAQRREALKIWRDLGDRLREGDALRWTSRLAWFVGRSEEAVLTAEEALAVLEKLPPGRELAMALSNRSQLHMLAEESDLAIIWGERAMALAGRLDETEILVHALNNVGTARLTLEDARGREELERSLTIAEAAGLEEHAARAYTNLSWSALHVRDLERANTYFDAGILFATDHDLDPWRLYLLSWRACLRLLEGNWTAADADASEVLDFPTATQIHRIEALTVQGLLRARRGSPGVDAPLAEALALAVATGEMPRLGPVRLARVEAAWLKGDLGQAVVEARAVVDLTGRVGSRWDIGELCLWLTRIGSPDAHGLILDYPDLPDPHRYALAGDWAAAAAAWEELGCPYEAALARLEGDETALRSALTVFKHLGARAAAAIAAKRLRDLGVRGIPRGPRPATRANPAHLTTRELEILPLVAGGRQNSEIAAQLYLSAKTVDHHVGSILAKLGVHARGDVATAAQQLGISLMGGRD